MNWSTFQAAIFAAFLTLLKDKRDLVVLARAGTGKTTTIIEAIIRLCKAQPRLRILACAFNKKNAVELQERLSRAGLQWKQAKAQTLNAVGLATCKRACWGKGVEVDDKKGVRIARNLVDRCQMEAAVHIDNLANKVAKLATMAKVTLTDPHNQQAMFKLCQRYQITWHEREASVVIVLAAQAMAEAEDDRMLVDFDDMLWFPHIFNLQPWKHDIVVVDECQDMNTSQLELARKSVKSGGRLVAVGDEKQAIYGWRGADSDFMPRMITQLKAETLPLPRTYRCGKNIVEEAKKIVPDYEAAEGNVDGIVRSCRVEQLDARPGDFVISRTNAPLLGLALDLLKRKIPATIQGRDLMGQLIGLIKKSGCTQTECLLQWVDQWETKERKALVKAKAEAEDFELLHDRCECLRVLSADHDTVEEVLRHLDEVFTDRDDSSKVTLSTVHRAKGLERDRVWLLMGTFKSGFDSTGQEANCLYVAITRAKDELVYVTGEV